LDVISQGREPKRNPRLPLSLPRRWRIAGGVAAVLVIAAVVAVVALGPRHTTERPSAGVPGASTLTPGVPKGGFAPGNSRSFVVCVPSTGACSVRVIVVGGVASRMTRNRLRQAEVTGRPGLDIGACGI
jgi:hypothetical protein